MADLRSFRSSLALVPFAALAVLGTPQLAEACGGTFCDNLPQAMPVDQEGEDILFISDGVEVEVQVRIQYDGEAERFAWVLPLQAIPEVSVGSDPLFTAMSDLTAPSWVSAREYDCDEDSPNWDDEGSIKLDLSGGGGDTGDGGPNVVFEETVGAYEVVVLQGGTAQEVVDFLLDNDYAQDPSAEPILQEYVDAGFLFAAVKLSAGADVSEIHPLSFKFPGNEPCIPIRLTRIAAKEDMGIRAYFLAQDRWVPSNYAHVVLNPLAYPWNNPSPQAYLGQLSLAADEAGGRAFVTEYAGPSNNVPTGAIFRDQWDESAFVGVDPITAIELIEDQGLNIHPLIRSILLEYIPPPENFDPNDFWNNIEGYVDLIDLVAWDSNAFAAALSERIIEPGFHAVEMLETWPKLTRLHTTLSPNEMIEDPVFHTNTDLPDVPVARVTTTENVLCGSIDSVFHVAIDSADYPLCVPQSASYPNFEDMPAALRIEQIPMMGPAQVVTDNSEAIQALYTSYEAGVECLGDETGTGETGDTGGGETDSEGDSGTPSTDSGGEGGESTETGPGYDLPYDVSCGCSTREGNAPLGIALGFLVLGLIGPWRRRD